MDTLLTIVKAYVMVGALLTIAIYGTQNKWPSPIETVVGLFFWPIAVYVGARGAIKEAHRGKEKDKGPA